MKFRVGQKVKVRKDLIAVVTYDKILFILGMEKYRGKIALITKMWKCYGTQGYNINLDNSNYTWTSTMFLPVQTSWKDYYSDKKYN